MKPVRVYKDNLREHIFRTLFFTDTVIFIGSGVILAVFAIVLYKFVLHINEIGLILSTIFLAEITYALVATVKIDHQPIYKIIPRAMIFSLSRKQFSMKNLRRTTGNFKIAGNYIMRKKKLLAVYEIRPFDIALLNDEERQRYYHHIKTMLHTLPASIQLITKKQTATVEEYHEHFFSLYETSHKKINDLITRYTNDLSTLIETNDFQLMKYYVVFSTHLTSEQDTSFVFSAQKLEDMAKRFSSALALERIQTIQLNNKQLIAYCQDYFRNTL